MKHKDLIQKQIIDTLLLNNVLLSSESYADPDDDLSVFEINPQFQIKIVDDYDYSDVIIVNEILFWVSGDIDIVDIEGDTIELNSFDPDERLLLLNYTKK